MILTYDELASAVKKAKEQGVESVLKVGCFDPLHVGHIKMFETIKATGRKLIVAVGSDDVVASLKVTPMFDESNRAYAVSAIRFVDYVVVLREADHRHILDSVRPDYYHLDEDNFQFGYKSKLCESFGIKLIIQPNIKIRNYGVTTEPHSSNIKNELRGKV